MKRFLLFILLVVVFIFSVTTIFAANPNFLVFDQNKKQVMVIGDDFKPIKSFEAGNCPSTLVNLLDNSGYLLLCKGSKNILGQLNQPGSLIYLDNQLNPTAKNLTLPGLVIQDFYLKDNWLLITQNTKDAPAPITVTVYDLKAGHDHQFNLDSLPTAYRFNAEHTLLAVTTIGITAKKEPAQLILINLTDFTMKSFPISTNPGQIYFINDTNLMVACGGFRKAFNYKKGLPIENFEKSQKAILHWIDTITSAQKATDIGYSPVVIIPDQVNPDTFYAAYSDTPYEKDVKSSFHKIVNGDILSDLKFTADPVNIRQLQSGNIALICREEFYLLNSEGTQILTEQKYPLKIDELIQNTEQTVGYLSVTNSGNLDVFDTVAGKLVKKLKIRSSLNIPLNLADLFASDLPPVAGFDIPNDDLPIETLPRKQVILSPDQKSLYVLASQYQFRNVDIETGNTISTTKFSQGKPNGIYLTANQKYVVVTTNTNYLLIDPLKNKPILNLGYSQNNTGDFPPEVVYNSPDGNTLVIPNNGILYIIDCQNGKLVNKLNTKMPKVKIVWIN